MPADDHTHDHGSELSEMQLRVKALETILTEKGYVDAASLDQIVENFETRIGPHIGARVVARAWIDAEFKRRLLEDATAAANTMGGFDPVRGASDRRREHARGTQPHRMHLVLLLPGVGVGPAAGLV
jgi:hypothetical protein